MFFWGERLANDLKRAKRGSEELALPKKQKNRAYNRIDAMFILLGKTAGERSKAR